MTKIFKFAVKIKGGGREGGRYEVLRPCHPPQNLEHALSKCLNLFGFVMHAGVFLLYFR